MAKSEREHTKIELGKLVEERTKELTLKNRELESSNAEIKASQRASLNLMEDLHSEIDERKQAEEKLRKSEAELRSLAESMPQIVWATRADGWNIYFNQQWVEYTGMTLEDSYGHGWNKPFHPDDQQKAWDAWYSAVNNNGIYSIEARLRRYDGEYRWWLVRGVPLIDEDGVIHKWFGTCTDIEEMKKAVEALSLSEEKFSRIFHSSPDAIMLSTIDTGIMIEVNESSSKITGYLKEELIGKSTFELNLWVNYEDRVRYAMNIQKHGFVRDFETKIRIKSGEIIDTIISGEIIEFSNKKFILSIIRDITERKQTENALQESEELLRLSTELANVAAWEYDFMTDTMARSKNHDSLYGFEQLGKWEFDTFVKATHPDDRDLSAAYIQKSVAIGGPDEYKFDFRVVYPDQSIHWLNVIGKVVKRNMEGMGILVRGFLIDITDRKHAEEEVKRTNEELLTINRVIAASTSIKSIKGILDAILAEAIHIVGLEGGTICLVEDDNTLKLISQKETSEATIRDLSENRIKIGNCLCGNCAKDNCPLILNNSEEVLKYATREVLRGEDIRFHAAFPLSLKEKCLGVLCVFTRTDKKPESRSLKLLETLTAQVALSIENNQLFSELEQRVQRRTTQLESVNKQLQAFTYSVSHDLKAPLRGIDGYSKLLFDHYLKNLNEEAQTFIKNIRSGTLQMSQLIEDLLTYSRLERTTFRAAKINIKNLIKSIISNYKAEIDDRKIKIIVEVENCEIISDVDGLSMAIRNLIENAIKFTMTRENPIIKINFEQTDSELLLSIKDNGIGFNMAYHDKIFEIFQRLHRSEDYPGTGIGLALVKKAMQSLGGTVWAESKIDKGATFYLKILKTNKS